jgi:hypothetical protein
MIGTTIKEEHEAEDHRRLVRPTYADAKAHLPQPESS